MSAPVDPQSQQAQVEAVAQPPPQQGQDEQVPSPSPPPELNTIKDLGLYLHNRMDKLEATVSVMESKILSRVEVLELLLSSLATPPRVPVVNLAEGERPASPNTRAAELKLQLANSAATRSPVVGPSQHQEIPKLTLIQTAKKAWKEVVKEGRKRVNLGKHMSKKVLLAQCRPQDDATRRQLKPYVASVTKAAIESTPNLAAIEGPLEWAINTVQTPEVNNIISHMKSSTDFPKSLFRWHVINCLINQVDMAKKKAKQLIKEDAGAGQGATTIPDQALAGHSHMFADHIHPNQANRAQPEDPTKKKDGSGVTVGVADVDLTDDGKKRKLPLTPTRGERDSNGMVTAPSPFAAQPVAKKPRP
eukprot:GFYU01006875.1.p1 GENE.GFYU01006875.1~~GFYU01006875.1.p1  ORF type:complete len:361 (-),score=83.24 GFYU01006875.1:329-1411(-)